MVLLLHQILETIMDVMQVLQELCENPQSHDKGGPTRLLHPQPGCRPP